MTVTSFGPFRYDLATTTLERDGQPLAVNQRGLLLIDTLLEAGGMVVSKDHLLDRAWPGTVVEESNLTVQIAALRKTLGPRKDGHDWIVTVPESATGWSCPSPRGERSVRRPGARSWRSCHSPTSAAVQTRRASSRGWSMTSSRSCHASRRLPWWALKIQRSTGSERCATSAFAMRSRAPSVAPAEVLGLPRISSTRRLANSSGRKGSTTPRPGCSTCRTASRRPWSACSSRRYDLPRSSVCAGSGPRASMPTSCS
ncbi:hypothetical protein B5V02_21550 [Mesorhizobium kowhaii]|uniref:OmpR/PhoB-type domain-containing protein n=1 Tax=Mesorhizobium kowhaii TaxID=1300272 RepID=A0A2W7C3V1_9HYPH|nr:hypothetical protein B5V02_21550 [Mesorhizobium kowhaii]